MAPLGQFILLGDSLTQGSHSQKDGFALAAELQNAYVRRLDIVNRGFSGYNTDHILTVLADVLPTPQQAKIQFLTIWFGGNDSNQTGTIGQFVPLDRFRSNLAEIVWNRSVAAHSPNVVLITPPPIEETLMCETDVNIASGKLELGQHAVDAKAYAQAVKETGIITGVPVVDIWGKFMEMAGWKEGQPLPGTKSLGKNGVLVRLLSDGLHLTPEGYNVVFDELLKVLKKEYPDYPPYQMPYVVKVPWERSRGNEFWDIAE
ncbi:GDSL Lipase/Acylhydrolase family protein-like protein [Amylocarpus encephaloides]|uniref:GDSL Lipase/Acylhydrolase family protein-like protein n=1 Tax=Amylocarpus encephaloides TaxID=45428 RepID=A0A9P7YFM3_9HELO|nr:GDSL Lipase/Acylhydrolase family protein-like protein [Amylocarpus encephaloides]